MLFSHTSFLSVPLLLLISFVAAYPQQASSVAPPLPQATDIYHFPNGSWVENLAIRSNGGILASFAIQPQIAYLDPSQPGAAPKTIATFPAPATGTLGITELQPDVFYVATNNFSFTSLSALPGKGQVWRLDMTKYDECADVSVDLIANFTDSLFVNGVTHIPDTNVVLVADSYLQVVWSLDVQTKQIGVAVNNTATASNPSNPFAVNGVHYQNGYLYFTNSGQGLYARVPIDHTTGAANGPVEELTKGLVHPDDFTLTGNGNDAYIADGTSNSVNFTAGTGESKPLCAVLGATAVQLGRTEQDKNTLYISSAGNETGYANPSGAIGGSISKFVLPEI